MALFRPTYTDKKTGDAKQSAVWWYEFVYAGKRIRESAQTARKSIAIEREKNRRKELERVAAGLPSTPTRDRIRRVSDVLKTYAAGYEINHRRKSVLIIRERSAHLDRLLGSHLLSDLTSERVLEYMKRRRGELACGRTINMELGILSRAVGFTWRMLWPNVKPLEENNDVGKALEPDEESRMLEAAAKSTSKLIYPFLYALAWTGMRSDEARTLTWSQVDFAGNEVIVGRAKSEKGKGRHIPLGANLRAVLEQHSARYQGWFGKIRPEWYVFPLSNRRAPVDPSKPVTTLKKAWQSVRTAAKVRCRLHDLRHSFCTKLAEAGVPESTMLDIMGHVSAAMLRRYSHIRVQARRDAISAIEARNSVVVLQEVPKVAGFSPAKSPVTH